MISSSQIRLRVPLLSSQIMAGLQFKFNTAFGQKLGDTALQVRTLKCIEYITGVAAVSPSVL